MRYNIPITDVRAGDIIMEGNRPLHVKEITHNACCKGGSHVNRGLCFDRIAVVDLKE